MPISRYGEGYVMMWGYFTYAPCILFINDTSFTMKIGVLKGWIFPHFFN